MNHYFPLFFTLFFFLSAVCFAEGAKVLNYDTEIVTDGKKLWKNYNLKLQINSSDDNEYCEFEIPYSEISKLIQLSGSIKDINGNEIRKLSKKDIITSSYFSNIAFYSDNMLKRFNLIHNQYPYIIEVSFKYEYSSFINIINWSPIWDSDLSTNKATLTFTYPSNYQFNKRTTGIDSIEKLSANEGLKSIKWCSKYEKFKRNILMPPFSTLNPSVRIAPIYFNYINNGNFESWKNFGDWEIEISNGLDILPLQEQLIIDKLTNGITDPKKIITVLYHYLQDNNRYTFVEIDFGGMQPYPADYVCKNRYGDCKALSNYMKALLKYKQIESCPVLVCAGKVIEKIDTTFPSQQFNHVFLSVPLPNDTIWLECTSNTSAPDYLGTFTQNRKGLMISNHKSELVHLPALRTEDCQNILTYNYNEPQDDKTIIETCFRFRGNEFESLNRFYKHATENEKEGYIDQFIPLRNIKINNWVIVPIHRDSSTIILKTNIETGTPYSGIANFLRIDHPSLVLPTFERERDRHFDVLINCPISSIDSIFYSYKFNEMILNDKDTISIDSKYGHFEMKKILSNQALTIIRKVTIPTQTIPLDEYANFYKFYQDILASSKTTTLKTNNH